MAASKTPIALFVYNRPEHTRRTLEALTKNKGAAHSKLFVFCDGPKVGASASDIERIDRVRALVKAYPWPGDIEFIESKQNRGLRQSICGGIDAVLEVSDRVIVLEDDLETSPGFLPYMNIALDLYADQERVFQVSGFMVKNRPIAPQTGFLRVSTSWGWSTWRRAWKHYRDDAEQLLVEVEKKGKRAFDLDGYSFHFEELQRNVKGDLNTWAVRWYASIFLNDGLCLYPRRTLVRNLGFDGSGVHCHDDATGYHNNLRFARDIATFDEEPTESRQYLRAMQSHYRKLLKLWTGTRFQDRLRNKVFRTTGIKI